MAPLPLRLTTVPGQTVGEGNTVDPTVGVGITVIVVVKMAVHPFAAVPTSVSVLLIVGTKATPFSILPDQA